MVDMWQNFSSWPTNCFQTSLKNKGPNDNLLHASFYHLQGCHSINEQHVAWYSEQNIVFDDQIHLFFFFTLFFHKWRKIWRISKLLQVFVIVLKSKKLFSSWQSSCGCSWAFVVTSDQLTIWAVRWSADLLSLTEEQIYPASSPAPDSISHASCALLVSTRVTRRLTNQAQNNQLINP